VKSKKWASALDVWGAKHFSHTHTHTHTQTSMDLTKRDHVWITSQIFYLSGFAHSARPGWRMVTSRLTYAKSRPQILINHSHVVCLRSILKQLFDLGVAYPVRFWQLCGFRGLPSMHRGARQRNEWWNTIC